MPTLNRNRPSRLTLYLSVAYALLLVYGTLFPFNGWLTQEAGVW